MGRWVGCIQTIHDMRVGYSSSACCVNNARAELCVRPSSAKRGFVDVRCFCVKEDDDYIYDSCVFILFASSIGAILFCLAV